MEPIHYLLMKAHTNLNRWILKEAAGLGLSPGQPKILECLARLGECNQKTIAQFCEIEQATVGSILLRMERDGLIRRFQREGNRRSLYVSLTPKGERLWGEAEGIFRRADRMACEGLGPEEREQLSRLLTLLCASAQAMGEEDAP